MSASSVGPVGAVGKMLGWSVKVLSFSGKSMEKKDGLYIYVCWRDTAFLLEESSPEATTKSVLLPQAERVKGRLGNTNPV